MPVPSREGSNFRPLWRFCHAFNRQEVTHGTTPPLRDVKSEGRSDYLYENKERHDKMAGEISDIYVDLTRILRKTADLDGEFAVNCVCGACFVREFTANIGWRAVSTQETPHPPAGRSFSQFQTCLPFGGRRSASYLSTFSPRRRSKSHQPSPRGEGGGHAPPGLCPPKGRSENVND
jgi:hypothetical protein